MKRVFQYQYDLCNRLIGVRSDTEQVRFEYDPAGNLVRQSSVQKASAAPLADQAPTDAPVEHRFCHICGAKLSANSRFCASCGTPVG